MKLKFGLTNIIIQLFITVMAGFVILTQMSSIRQPVKLLIEIIAVLALVSLAINIYNYIKEDKD